MKKIIVRSCLPWVASFALLLSGSTAFGQTATTTTSDAQFAKNAAQANLAEVQLGQLAERNGTTLTVKDFGKRMVADHSTAQDKLKAAAQKDDITLPDTMSGADQALYNRLSKLSGEKFDKAYAENMVRDHTRDISQFRHEANDGRDVAIKSFASGTLPTLQKHLKLAEQMSQTVSVSTNTTSKTRG
jgi:putative membrane protein